MCSGVGIIESKKVENISTQLPAHIIEVIFSKLAIPNLPSCRLVCKAWNRLVLDYASSSKLVPGFFFVCTVYEEFRLFSGVQSKDMGPAYLKMDWVDFDEKYLQGKSVIASFRFESGCPGIEISNSCNGLLCIINGVLNHPKTYAAILNPMTNEYIQLPGFEENFYEDHPYEYYTYGFGFSPKMKQYKVVRASREWNKHGCMVEIFTFGKSRQWSYLKSLTCVILGDGVYFNGALYWVGLNEEWENVMCYFDVGDETFEMISLPKVGEVDGYWAIGVFNGNLYATFKEGDHYKVEVWRMQSHGGGENEELWMEEFVFDIPRGWESQFPEFVPEGQVQLIKACENGEILCLFDRFYLFMYNPTTQRTKILTGDKGDQRYFSIYQIHESLTFDSLEKVLVGGG